MAQLPGSLPIDDYRARERAHFDRLAEQSRETWWGHSTAAAPFRLRRRVELLRPRLARQAGGSVLEIGCGTGIFTREALGAIPDLTLLAVDISPKAVEIARSRCEEFGNCRIEVGDITANRFDENQFDAIVGNSVLHHIDLRGYLPLALRALRPGGLFWFSEPNMMNPQVAVERNVRPVGRWLQNSEDETAFLRWRLRGDLREAGFVDVSVRPFDFLHPLTPRPLLRTVDRLGRAMERLPVFREIAGSLEVAALKPEQDSSCH